MRRCAFQLILICLFCSTTLAQTLTVIEAGSNQPVPYALIQNIHTQSSLLADEQGKAEMSDFSREGPIQISSLGFQSLVTNYDELQEQKFVVYLDKSGFNLDQIVVSATRWRKSHNSSPSTITSIDAREVALQNPQTAADLLGISGKVFIQKSQQGGGSPMIRGFATNRLIYTVDGVRMNNAIFRGGNIQNVINLDAFSVENVEVLFGPESVTYGSDAIGGVMAFHTISNSFADKGHSQLNGQVQLRHSTANKEKTGHVHLNWATHRLSVISSVSYWNYDDLRQGRHGPQDYVKPFYVDRINDRDVILNQEDSLLQVPSAYDQFNLLNKVSYKISEKARIDYAFHLSQTSDFGRYDRHNRVSNGEPRYGEWNYGPQKWSMHHLKYSSEMNGKLMDKMSLSMAAQGFEESRISRLYNDSIRTDRREKVKAYSINWDAFKQWDQQHILSYGLEYIKNDVESEGQQENIINGLVSDASDRYPQADWQSFGLFMNYEYALNSKTSLRAGWRMNHFALNADFESNLNFYPLPFNSTQLRNTAFTGSFGMVIRPSDSWVIKYQLATAFRAPNVDDIGKIFDSEPGVLIVPNTDLGPEYAYSADLAMTKVISDRVKWDMSVFYTRLDNALIRRPFVLNGQSQVIYEGVLSEVQAIQNAAIAEVWGWQLGVEWRIASTLKLYTDINIQEGNEESEEGEIGASRHAAPLFGVVRLQYESSRFSCQLYTQFQASVDHNDLAFEERGKTDIYALDENGQTYAPSWYSLNLKTQYRITDAFTLSLGMENITDRRYRPYSSGISAAGRNIIISVSSNF